MASSLSIFYFSFLPLVAWAASPIEVEWSPQAQGADGPWHAIRTWVGTTNTSIDLYPGGSGPSNLLSIDYCRRRRGQAKCNANPQGFWDPSLSQPPANSKLYSISKPKPWMTPLSSKVTGGVLIDWQQIPMRGGQNISTYLGINTVVSGGYALGTSAQTYDFDLGTLSLGSVQTGLNQAGNSTVAVEISPNTFYESGLIPSASYGLHYGSVTAQVPPSLVYGGYDAAHIVGPVISQQFGSNGETVLQLRDIGLGTAAGGQPSSFLRKPQTGYLTSDSASPSFQTVSINPSVPYMVLPRATCGNLTEGLPLVYNSNHQLWQWDTSNPEYSRIVNGANFLSFTFTQLGMRDVTIKVPFQLLNLTLSSPLSVNSISYFPCLATSGTQYALGRAFLQAAFYGGNWMPKAPLSTSTDRGTWFLAQAPGPNMMASSVSSIADDANQIQASAQRWEDSWAGTWQPLPGDNPGSTVPTNMSSSSQGNTSGLSTAAKVGIAVPVTIVALLAIAGTALYVVHRQRQKRIARDTAALATSGDVLPPENAKVRLEKQAFRFEMSASQPPREMQGTIPRFEMP